MDKLGKNKYKCKQSELYNLKVFFRNYLPNIYFLPKKNPMDGGAWWATVHGVAKSRTRLSDFTFTLFSLAEMGFETHRQFYEFLKEPVMCDLLLSLRFILTVLLCLQVPVAAVGQCGFREGLGLQGES